MKPAENIKKLIQNVSIKTNPKVNKAVLNSLFDELDKSKKADSAALQPSMWRIIMKNRITKFAAAAVIIIAVLAGIYFISNKPLAVTCCAWADIIRPIMDARTAEFDIIIGEEDEGPVLHDMVMGPKIRRIMEGMKEVSIIDLGSSRILTLDHENKKAVYISMKDFPQIPNYIDQLRDVIRKLQDTPGFVVEELGEQLIEGQKLFGFKARHPKVEIVLWVDPATSLPVRIEQEEGQMKVICKNIRFDVPMDESLFDMNAPEGYKVEQQELNLFGSTEEDFIEGLRIQAEKIYDGRFPDDVSVEYYTKMAPTLGEKLNKLQISDDEKMAIGMKLTKGLMFIRFFKGEGKWHYAGKDVDLGDANTAIFWYRPAGSNTYHVIYGDLSVEDLAEQDLPKLAENR